MTINLFSSPYFCLFCLALYSFCYSTSAQVENDKRKEKINKYNKESSKNRTK